MHIICKDKLKVVMPYNQYLAHIFCLISCNKAPESKSHKNYRSALPVKRFAQKSNQIKLMLT